MKQNIAVTLDEQLVAFLDSHFGGNHSEYLNQLLVQERKRTIEAELIKALQEDCCDPEYLIDLQLWDAVVADELDDAKG